MRVVQTLGRFATDYVWDPAAGTPMVPQETNREDFYRVTASPADTAVYRTRSENTYVYGVGLISVTDSANNQRYVMPDALGSVRTVVNGADGGVYTGYSYDAFGVPNELGGLQTTFRFAGEQYDYKARKQAGVFGLGGTPGLQYLRARFYDPTLGRFLTRDPLPGSARDPQSLNAYAYVQNNPVNRVDPTGMFSEGPQDDQFLALLLAAGIDEEVLKARACLAGYIGLITSVAAVVLLLTPPFGSPTNPVNIQAASVFAGLAVLAGFTISTQCGDSG